MFGTIKISLDQSCPTAAKTIKSRDLSAFYMKKGGCLQVPVFFRPQRESDRRAARQSLAANRLKQLTLF